MCSCVCMSAVPHGHLRLELGKNLCWYSPMGACPVAIRVNWAHRALVNPIDGSHEPPLAYVGLITTCFLSSKSRKSWPLFLLVTKLSCHSLSALSYFFFLLKRCEFLLGSIGSSLDAFTWLSTSLCCGHSTFFGHCQNWMEFWLS